MKQAASTMSNNTPTKWSTHDALIALVLCSSLDNAQRVPDAQKPDAGKNQHPTETIQQWALMYRAATVALAKATRHTLSLALARIGKLRREAAANVQRGKNNPALAPAFPKEYADYAQAGKAITDAHLRAAETELAPREPTETFIEIQ